MTKSNKIFISISSILTLLFAFSCTVLASDAGLVGTFKSMSGNSTLEFTEDGTFTIDRKEGTYHLKDDKLIFIYKNGDVIKQDYDIIDFTLILYNADGTGTAYVKDKSKLALNITDRMAEMRVSKYIWPSGVPESKNGNGIYTLYGCDLIQDLGGTLTIVEYNDGSLHYWRWDHYLDDEAEYEIVLGILNQIGEGQEMEFDGFDASIQYPWLDYAEGNYDPEWTINGVTLEESGSWEGKKHELVLLRKGDEISLQYFPINNYWAFSHSYHDF